MKGDFTMRKRLLATLMSMIMCLSMSSVAFAAETTDTTINNDECQILETSVINEDSQVIPRAGTETWNYTGYIGRYAGGFSMEGRNLTPVKTIAVNNLNQYLVISTDFSCSVPSILTVQIREYPSGRVLAQNSSGVTTSGTVNVGAGPNMSGKQVQIFTMISDSNGNYVDSRVCNIDYWYTLRADGEGGDW